MDPMSIIVGLVVGAIVLMIVDRLDLGLSVGGFVNALIAAAAIGVVSWGVGWLLEYAGIDLTTSAPLWNAVIYLIVSAIVLWIAARVISGFTTAGFTGALVAAIAIAVIVWIIAQFFSTWLPFFGA